MTFRSAYEARMYLTLLFVRLGAITIAGVAGAVGSVFSEVHSLSVWVFLSSFLILMLSSAASVVAGAVRGRRSMTLSERLSTYTSLQHLDEAAETIGASPSIVRRWTQSMILTSVLAVAVAVVCSVFFAS